MSHDKDRAVLVDRARRHLEAAGRPRMVMTAFLAVAMSAGVLASAALLRLGLDAMVFRYPLAVGAAYATFLGILWLWVVRQRAAVPLTDDPEGLFVPGLAALGAAKIGADLAAGADPVAEDSKRRASWLPGNFSGGGGSNLDGIGEGCGVVLILVLVAALCSLIVGAYLVATSPVFLAELLVDGVLVGAMAKAIDPESPPHWLQAVLDRTAPLAILTAMVFALVGHGIQWAAPHARTMAEALAADHRGR